MRLHANDVAEAELPPLEQADAGNIGIGALMGGIARYAFERIAGRWRGRDRCSQAVSSWRRLGQRIGREEGNAYGNPGQQEFPEENGSILSMRSHQSK